MYEDKNSCFIIRIMVEKMKSKIKYCFLIICFCALLFSCEMKAPTIPDNGAILHQKPKPPENLTATRGYKDSITLSWDPVDNCNLYKIYGSEASDFGNLKLMGTSTTNKFVLKKNSTPSIAIDPNQSYIFTVRAVTFFDNTSENLESLNSNYAEGTLAPESITLHAVVTDNYVDAYWNSSNIFSAWNSSNVPEMLYDANFKLSYMLKNSDDTLVELDNNNPDDELPWLYQRIDINQAGMQQEQSYVFNVSMDILDSSGTLITTVNSNEIVIDISSTKVTTPIAKEDIKVSNNYYDKINIQWNVPLWTEGASMENSFFKIERSEVGSDKWDIIVDEISEKKDVPEITLIGYSSDNRMTLSYDDTTVIEGKNYVYRITNAAMDTYGTLYQHSTDELQVSEAGCMYMPADPTFDASYVSTNPISATLTFNINADALADDRLSFGIYREITHNTTTETGLFYKFTDNTYTCDETLECTSCVNRSHEYKYQLVLLGSNDEKVKDYGYFKFDGSDSITLAPGDILVADSLKASIDRIDVALNWKQNILKEDVKNAIKYYYSFNDSSERHEFVPEVVNTTESYIEMSYLIDTEGVDVNSVLFIATTPDGIYQSSLSVDARSLKPLSIEYSYSLDDNTFTFSWDSSSLPSDLIYSLDYSVLGSNQWNSSSLSVTSVGGKSAYVVNASDMAFDPNKKYIFRISFKRSTYESDGIIYTELNHGYYEYNSFDLNIDIGNYVDKTKLTWTESGNLTSYKFYLYDGNNLNSAQAIDMSAAVDNSLEVQNIPSDKQYFAYSLVLEESGVTFHTPISANKSNVTDKYGETVRKDRFIPFDATSVSDLTVAESLVDNIYKPYLVVTWDRVYGASSYDITVVGDGENVVEETVTINVDELLHNNNLTESGDSTSVGYISYDKSTCKYTYHSDAGTMKRVLSLKDFKIIGYNADKSLSSKESAYSSSTELHRLFKASELVNVVNQIISKELVNANTKFGGDWFPPTSISSQKQHEYKTDSCKILSHRGGGTYTSFNQEPGSMSFTNYSTSVDWASVVLNTSADIRLFATNGGGAGYLGTDPLETVGKDEIGVLSISIDKMPQYELKYKNVNKSNKNGSYDVTVNGITTNVSDSDSLVSVFEGL